MHNASFHSAAFLDGLEFRFLGANVKIHTSVVLIGCHRMSLGDDIRIDPFTIVSAGNDMMIGSNVHIAAHCLLSGAEEIELEDFVGISHGAKILSSTDDFKGGFLTGPTVPDRFKNVHAAPVHIERHSIVGANAVVLPGTRIGTGTTVGALSLVKGQLDPWIIAAGVPACEIGKRDREGVLEKEAAYLGTKRAAAN